MERSGAPGKAPTPWALHLTLVGAQLAFAAMAVSAHTALEHIPPLQFAAVRITLGLPGLAALAWREGGALTWRMAAWGVPLAVGMVGAQILVFVCNHWVGTRQVRFLLACCTLHALPLGRRRAGGAHCAQAAELEALSLAASERRRPLCGGGLTSRLNKQRKLLARIDSDDLRIAVGMCQACYIRHAV